MGDLHHSLCIFLAEFMFLTHVFLLFFKVHRRYLEKQSSAPFCFHFFALRRAHTYTKLNPNLNVVFLKRTFLFQLSFSESQAVCGLSVLPAPWRQ